MVGLEAGATGIPLVTGGIGSGKTFSTEALIRALIKAGCPMLVTCVKVDEYARYRRICEELGCLDRLRRITPERTGIDLMAQLLRDGTPADAASFLMNLSDIEKASSGGDNAAFWRNLEEGAIRYSILLCVLTGRPPSLDNLYAVILSAPNLPNQDVPDKDGNVNQEYQFEQPLAGRMRLFPELMRLLYQQTQRGKNIAEFNRIKKFFMAEMCAERVHGPCVAGINGLLGRLIDQPLRNALTQTTLSLKAIEAKGLIAVIDYPLMRYHTAGRLYACIWVMLMQRYLMNRDASKIKQPLVIVRDEAGWTLHGEFDMKANNTLRSQKVCDIALVQCLDTLERSLGGKMAHHEAMALASNHMHKLLFQNYSGSTNKWASEMGGMYREVQVSSGNQEAQDFAGKALGARTPSWSLSYQNLIRPEDFTRLPVGVAVLMSGGRVEVVDFRRGS